MQAQVLPLAAQSGVDEPHTVPHEPQFDAVEIDVSQPPEAGPVQCS